MELRYCDISFGDNPDGRCVVCGGAVPPRRRRFCSRDCSATYSENHGWTSARLAKLAAAGYACERCGTSELDAKIEVHHLDAPVGGRKRYGIGCHNHQSRLMVLCDGPMCHPQETRLERAKPGSVVQLEMIA